MIKKDIIPITSIKKYIFFIREKKVMIDRDLAELYGVSTKRLNEQVKRNIDRFPPDFMFRLDKDEKYELVANCDRLNTLKHSNVNPSAFTEQGVAMLSSVLNSKRAIEVNIQIMRAFVKLRRFALTNKELSKKIESLEKKYDKQFKVVFEALKQLMKEPEKETKKIGF
ncbi:MAG: ORF6N domain-containing protein [Atribacterota bacterium]